MTWGKTHRHEKDLFVQSFGSSNELIDAWEKSLNMDILFIASAFPGDVSGFETAYRIQREQSGIPIILMMKDKRVIFDHYEVESLRFLFDPINEELFSRCMNLCWAQAANNLQNLLVFRTRDQIVRINRANIVYIEHLQRHTRIHATDREAPCQITSTLQEVFARLPDDQFLQCHKSYIINRKYVSQVNARWITLCRDQMIPLGKTFRAAFLKRMLENGNG